MTRFLGSATDLSPALGADFTPCGIRPRHHASPCRGWRAASCAPSVRTSILRTNAPPICGSHRRSTRPLPSWRELKGNLRTSSSRSLVASAIRRPNTSEAMTRFLGSATDLSPALGADFTPCGIRPRHHASPCRGWRAASCAPSVRTSILRTNAPPICGSHRRSTRPLPSWRELKGNEASAIGSVSLAMASSLAGPATGSEVPVCPALRGSADLRLPGSTRFTSPLRSSPRVASCGVRGLSPREISNDLKIKALLSSIRT